MCRILFIFALCFAKDTTFYLLYSPSESPPRNKKSENDTLGVCALECRPPHKGIVACGEPRRCMDGLHFLCSTKFVQTCQRR